MAHRLSGSCASESSCCTCPATALASPSPAMPDAALAGIKIVAGAQPRNTTETYRTLHHLHAAAAAAAVAVLQTHINSHSRARCEAIRCKQPLSQQQMRELTFGSHMAGLYDAAAMKTSRRAATHSRLTNRRTSFTAAKAAQSKSGWHNSMNTGALALFCAQQLMTHVHDGPLRIGIDDRVHCGLHPTALLRGLCGGASSALTLLLLGGRQAPLVQRVVYEHLWRAGAGCRRCLTY